jgi:hypothetical protein
MQQYNKDDGADKQWSMSNENNAILMLQALVTVMSTYDGTSTDKVLNADTAVNVCTIHGDLA